jgi:transcriptional regulator with XRE-family HTH domain
VTIANTTKLARLAKDLPQKRVAELCRITPQHLSLIESNTRQPSLEIALKLARVLDVSVAALFEVVVEHSQKEIE